MCFRPSAVTHSNDSLTTNEQCPTCGMPIKTQDKNESNTCPHCNNAIPQDKKVDVPRIL